MSEFKKDDVVIVQLRTGEKAKGRIFENVNLSGINYYEVRGWTIDYTVDEAGRPREFRSYVTEYDLLREGNTPKEEKSIPKYVFKKNKENAIKNRK